MPCVPAQAPDVIHVAHVPCLPAQAPTATPYKEPQALSVPLKAPSVPQQAPGAPPQAPCVYIEPLLDLIPGTVISSR